MQLQTESRPAIPSAQPTTADHRGRVLALLCAVYFLVILDAAIVRLTLPALHRALGLSATSQTWVANAYMLSFGTLLLLGGRVADLAGRKRVLLAGWVCSQSPHSPVASHRPQPP